MSKFWLIYEPVLSATVVQTVDSILVDQTPAFLDSIRLTTFTLGTKAPRVESVKAFPKTDPDVVVRFREIKNEQCSFLEQTTSAWSLLYLLTIGLWTVLISVLSNI
jgi:hypothetical protein